MVNQAQVIRENRERDVAAQIAAGNYGAAEVQEVASGIPASASNDPALAAHLKETRDKSAEYALLRSADAREQWETLAANNFLRDQRNKELIKEQVAAAKANQAFRDNAEGDRLALEMQTLTDEFPANWSPETLPIEKLRRLADLREQVNRLAAATGAPGLDPGVLESGGPLAAANVLQNLSQPQLQAKPETFPDGSLYQLQNLSDGNVEVRLITGEVFKGDPITVTQRMAEAQVNTKRWAQRARAQQSQPMAEPMQLNQQPTAQPTEQTSSGSLADDLATRQADAIARQLGFNDLAEAKQSIQEMGLVKEQVRKFEEQELAARFHATCSDFPDTEETANTVMQIISSNGWQPNLESLQAAHALAIRNGLYQPLTAEQIQIANGVAPQQQTRQAPPPMLRTNNPELTNAAPSPWEMSMSDLRKLAIKQQLDSDSPGYR